MFYSGVSWTVTLLKYALLGCLLWCLGNTTRFRRFVFQSWLGARDSHRSESTLSSPSHSQKHRTDRGWIGQHGVLYISWLYMEATATYAGRIRLGPTRPSTVVCAGFYSAGPELNTWLDAMLQVTGAPH